MATARITDASGPTRATRQHTDAAERAAAVRLARRPTTPSTIARRIETWPPETAMRCVSWTSRIAASSGAASLSERPSATPGTSPRAWAGNPSSLPDSASSMRPTMRARIVGSPSIRVVRAYTAPAARRPLAIGLIRPLASRRCPVRASQGMFHTSIRTWPPTGRSLRPAAILSGRTCPAQPVPARAGSSSTTAVSRTSPPEATACRTPSGAAACRCAQATLHPTLRPARHARPMRRACAAPRRGRPAAASGPGPFPASGSRRADPTAALRALARANPMPARSGMSSGLAAARAPARSVQSACRDRAAPASTDRATGSSR